MIRKDRVDKRGGGVILCVDSNLRAEEWQLQNLFPEQIWCKIQNRKNRELLVGVCYQTPNEGIYGPTNDLLTDMLYETAGKQILLMGDFNYPDINWNEYCAETERSQCNWLTV
jgi:hypothetical protein